MKLIILGAPGAGKGTQAQMIVEKLGIPHISMGDILREAVREKTYKGEIIQSYIGEGQLVPDKIIYELLTERIQSEDCKNGYLLDGYPRTMKQVELLYGYQKIDIVLDIEVDQDVLIDRITGRLSCPSCRAVYHVKAKPPAVEDRCDECRSILVHRSDDTEETLKRRLNIYHIETKPLIKFYSDIGILIKIDGNQEMNEIHESIKKSLGIG